MKCSLILKNISIQNLHEASNAILASVMMSRSKIVNLFHYKNTMANIKYTVKLLIKES